MKLSTRIRWLLLALKRLASSSTRSKNILLTDYMVVSTGGTASTAIMKHMSSYVSINSPGDNDGGKHVPSPKAGVKTLFIYADPERVVKSLDRRGNRFLRHHGAKLGSLCSIYLPRRSAKKCLKRAIRRQIVRFRKASERRPDIVLCLHFDEVFEKGKAIADFFHIADPDFLKGFPQREHRL